MPIRNTEVSVLGATALKRRMGVFVWQPVAVVVILHALAFWALYFFSWTNLIGFLISHFVVGCIGGVIGLHRYFSHRSFKCGVVFENVLAFLATLNLQQGPVTWAMYHRAHHRFSDREGDPHSGSEGFFWAHIGWLFYLAPNGFRKNSVSVADWTRSPFVIWLDKNHLQVNFLTALVFYFLIRDVGLFLWVFPLRVVVMWHSTWLINSYVHSAGFGKRQLNDTDVKNSPLVSALLYGEGWHKNHHKFPGLPRAGLEPSQFDPAYWVLVVFDRLRLIQFNKSVLERLKI